MLRSMLFTAVMDHCGEDENDARPLYPELAPDMISSPNRLRISPSEIQLSLSSENQRVNMSCLSRVHCTH